MASAPRKISDTPFASRCIFPPKAGRVETDVGLSLELASPLLPLTFYCGSKNRPTTLNIRVLFYGTPVVEITKVTLDVKIGDKIAKTVSINQANLKQKFIEVTLKLDTGNELKPLPFFVNVIFESDRGVSNTIIKQAYCVMMTAPCTQRRKATSALAWQELLPFLHDSQPGKNSKQEKLCDTDHLSDLITGRWNALFSYKQPIDERFISIVNDLSRNSFFQKCLTHPREPNDPLSRYVTEKEFRNIWSWYESTFSLICDQQNLFFKFGIPEVKGREETETYLASFNTVQRTYTIRFASKEDNICLSVYRKEQGYKHFPIPFKNLSTIADLVTILEDAGFLFINKKGQPVGLKNVLQPILGKQSVENELGDYSSPSTEFYGVIADKKIDADSLSSSNVANYFRKLGVLNSSAFEQNGIDGQRITTEFLTAQRLNKFGFDANERNIILENIPEFRKNPHTPPVNRIKRAEEEDPSLMVGFKRRMEATQGFPHKVQKCEESVDLYEFLIADATQPKSNCQQQPQTFHQNPKQVVHPSPPQSTIQQQLQQLDKTLLPPHMSPPTNNFNPQNDYPLQPYGQDDGGFNFPTPSNHDSFGLSESIAANLTNPLTGSLVGGLEMLDPLYLSIRTPSNVDNNITKDFSKDQIRNSLFSDASTTLKDFLSNTKNN